MGPQHESAVQSGSCQLSPIPGPYGYRLRGDRCEGLYQKEVGGSPLFFVSLTGAVPDFDPASGAPLVVRWSAPGDGDLVLRAEGTRPKLYYRMESRPTAASGRYDWPADVLAALKIRRDHIGLLAWTRFRVGDVEREVHIPLYVTQGDSVVECPTYHLAIVPGVRLEEVYVTLASISADGAQPTWLRKNRPLGYGFYPAERVIDVPVAELATPGLYELEISATLASGGSTALKRWVYQAAGSPFCPG